MTPRHWQPGIQAPAVTTDLNITDWPAYRDLDPADIAMDRDSRYGIDYDGLWEALSP